MKDVKEYLVGELGMAPVVADMTIKKISKHQEVYAEFETAIETGNYPENGMKINGYSALDIHNLAGFMNMGGVYNFMVTLKEKPEEAQKMIDSGFPRK